MNRVAVLYVGPQRATILADEPEGEEARLARARLEKRGYKIVRLPQGYGPVLRAAPKSVRAVVQAIIESNNLKARAGA